MEIDGGAGYSNDGRQKKACESSVDVENTPARSVEGWVLLIRNVHEEASEDDVVEAIVEEANADVKNLHMNLDRRTGLVKGYCLVELATVEEAKRVVEVLNGFSLHGKALKVDWAFSKGPHKFL